MRSIYLNDVADLKDLQECTSASRAKEINLWHSKIVLESLE